MLRQLTKHLTVFALAAALFAPLGAFGVDYHGTPLLWEVVDTGDPSIPDTGPTDLKYIDELVSRPDGYNVNGARIRVASDGAPIYLNLFDQESGTEYVYGMLPIIPQLEPGCDDPIFSQAGPVWTDLGTYGNSTYSFLVELGHMDENGNWTVMAVSEIETYDALQTKGFTTSNSVNYPNMTPWTPSFTVPEPSGGLLLLVGGALLSLRRRRRGESES